MGYIQPITSTEYTYNPSKYVHTHEATVQYKCGAGRRFNLTDAAATTPNYQETVDFLCQPSVCMI